jgi:alkylated DNA repair dioxygenase AlkB
MSHAGPDFTWCLVNMYPDGESYISNHADDEKCVAGHQVRTYSFGATRKFVVKERAQGTKRKADAGASAGEGATAVKGAPLQRHVFELEHGSCAIMKGENFQKRFTHGVPQMKRVKEWRISITPRG